MGAGIAKQFRETFGGQEELKDQRKKVGGGVVLLRRGEERNIYYMITKEKYYHKPSYKSEWDALKELKKVCLQNQDLRLAMPKIACGLDGLEWEKV
ncbi:hypothetical protein NQ318_010071 [Aromia moschata]|uniref:Macro domain-containing protein n=1 Tax=Aromia moschata TaxID=1265417 RepID=A0AAV8YE93_9CUCU|nr:hypothetical protein NQ318_010071 [Aromia moschata]